MKILFVHQNFPGQFKFLAPALAEKGHDVVALTIHKKSLGNDVASEKVRTLTYSPRRGTSKDIHPWVTDFETKIIRGEACLISAVELNKNGFVPDVIIAHPGWGESLFLKEVWPEARLGIYCEFYYHSRGADTNFDPEFPYDDFSSVCKVKLKNLHTIFQLESSDGGISPTHWQASTYPEQIRSKISVIHDGIDTKRLAPNADIGIVVTSQDGTKSRITAADEVVTFVNRNLEPYRGYHIFMRALPHILSQRKNARVILVGGDDVSYGSKPDEEKYGRRSWKSIFVDEVKAQISIEDWNRVHFVGQVEYQNYISILQISSCHVYLTYPFVLSWSLLEAMSVGCAIVASDTQPLQEAITHGETGLLVDFFDHQALAETVSSLLDNSELREELGRNAREFAVNSYDLETVCLPKQLAWVNAL